MFNVWPMFRGWAGPCGRLAVALTLCGAQALGNAQAMGQTGSQEVAGFGSSLPPLLEFARQNNPELRMRDLERDVASVRESSAGALPDPMLQLELMDVTNTMSGGSTSILPGQVGETRYRVIQPLPFFGKRGLRSEVAAAQTAQSRRAYEAGAVELDMRVKSAFARYYGAFGQRRVLNETLTLLQALERLVLTRYGVGLVPQQDAVRAQTEVTAMRVELIDSERAVREARAQLNAALPRAADAPLAEPVVLPSLPPVLSYAELSARLRERSPELATLRHAVEAADRSRALTYRERYPDFSVGMTNNRPREGTPSWDVMVEMNIPLQQPRRRSEETAADREVAIAEARLAVAEARLSGRLGELLAAYESARDKARLIEGTFLPQARATLQAAEAGYETGRVNFDTLIEAERQILRTRLDLLNSEVEARMRLAEIEQLVGETL